MTLTEFYQQVARRLPDGLGLAPKPVTHAVLVELAARLPAEEAAELGAELPEELGDLLAEASGSGPLVRDEFIEALASRLDLDDDEAEAAAQAVLVSVRRLLEPSVSIEQVLEGLSPDLAQLMS